MNAPASPVVIQLLKAAERERAAWMFVGKAWQDCHPSCEECGFCKVWDEGRPYGEGIAYEAMSECTLGSRASDRPEQCPAYREHLEEQESEQ